MAIERIKILGALLELLAKQHCQSSLFTSKLGQIGQIGSAVLLVAPKQSPGFHFSISMGANYSFEVKNIVIWVPKFFTFICSFCVLYETLDLIFTLV